ncbi:MAG: hypothetical protein ABIP51_20570 [Bacteroidia bacterium]
MKELEKVLKLLEKNIKEHGDKPLTLQSLVYLIKYALLENSLIELEKLEMKKGDKVIWDSNFDYDLGYYLGKGVTYNTFLIDKVTGIVKGPVSYSISQIKPYTEELHKELKEKYSSNKNF